MVRYNHPYIESRLTYTQGLYPNWYWKQKGKRTLFKMSTQASTHSGYSPTSPQKRQNLPRALPSAHTQHLRYQDFTDLCYRFNWVHPIYLAATTWIDVNLVPHLIDTVIVWSLPLAIFWQSAGCSSFLQMLLDTHEYVKISGVWYTYPVKSLCFKRAGRSSVHLSIVGKPDNSVSK